MPVTPLSGRPRGVSWSPRYARQRPLSMHIRKYTTFGSAGFDAAHFIRPAKRGRVVEGARASTLRTSSATAIAGEGDRPAGAVEGGPAGGGGGGGAGLNATQAIRRHPNIFARFLIIVSLLCDESF